MAAFFPYKIDVIAESCFTAIKKFIVLAFFVVRELF